VLISLLGAKKSVRCEIHGQLEEPRLQLDSFHEGVVPLTPLQDLADTHQILMQLGDDHFVVKPELSQIALRVLIPAPKQREGKRFLWEKP
jgi:hypothetical protein